MGVTGEICTELPWRKSDFKIDDFVVSTSSVKIDSNPVLSSLFKPFTPHISFIQQIQVSFICGMKRFYVKLRIKKYFGKVTEAADSLIVRFHQTPTSTSSPIQQLMTFSISRVDSDFYSSKPFKGQTISKTECTRMIQLRCNLTGRF